MQVKSVGKQKKKKNMLRKDIAYQPELTQTLVLSLMIAVRWDLTKPGIITVISLNRRSSGNLP